MYVVPTVHCPVLCNCCSVMSQLTVYNTTARFPNVTVSPLILSLTVSSSVCGTAVACSCPDWTLLPCSHAEDVGCRGFSGSNAADITVSAGCWCTRTFPSFKWEMGGRGLSTLSLTGMWWSRLRRESTPATCTRKKNSQREIISACVALYKIDLVFFNTWEINY